MHKVNSDAACKSGLSGNNLQPMRKSNGRKTLEKWQLEDAARLRKLFDAREPKISQEAFGAAYGIGSQGLLAQYLNAVIPLNLLAASRFANGLGCALSEISPTLAALGKEIAESLRVGTVMELTPTQLDLLRGHENAPPDAKKAIEAAVEPFIPRKRRGSGSAR
jgi:hypothetical protein